MEEVHHVNKIEVNRLHVSPFDSFTNTFFTYEKNGKRKTRRKDIAPKDLLMKVEFCATVDCPLNAGECYTDGTTTYLVTGRWGERCEIRNMSMVTAFFSLPRKLVRLKARAKENSTEP